MKDRIYCCIDLKSFYASVECVERGLDPFKVNLIVADPARTDKSVCLAVTPAMKELGVRSRCRVFEIPKHIEYITAKPRMKLYVKKSTEIYSIYLQYISSEDIHVYSVDEVFIDLTDYVKIYKKTAYQVAKMLIDKVYEQTGITATVGIGTNLFLAKIALDITAKKSSDFMGYLDEDLFKKTIWHHKPITDIWNIGKGTAKRLAEYGITDLYGVAHASEKLLYRLFGINAELLIDHANGIEPCTIRDIHAYKSKHHSLTNSQILFCNYNFDDAFTIVKEMVDGLLMELIDKNLVTDGIILVINYADKTQKHTGGTMNIGGYTSSGKRLLKHFKDYYYQTTDRYSPIRRVTVGFNNVVREEFSTIDLFSSVESQEKEKKLLKTVVDIKKKYGKNALLKGLSYSEKATARERNTMVGGHAGGEDED